MRAKLAIAALFFLCGAASVYALQAYTNAAELNCIRQHPRNPEACAAETFMAEAAFRSNW